MPALDIQTVLETTTDDTPDWLVHDMLCQGTMVVLAGEPGVGKSVLSYTLALAVASDGVSFLGRPVAPGVVLYFDEENSLPDVRQYLRWAWRGLGQPPVATLAQRFRLHHFSLAAHGRDRYDWMFQLALESHPHLIVLDTTSPACQIADENDNAEASRAIGQLRRVRSAAGPQATMLLLKHARFAHTTEERRTIRGAKTWLGELDAVLYHVAATGRPRKDGLRGSRLEPDKVRAFGLRHSVVIGPEWVRTSTGQGLRLTEIESEKTPRP